MTDIKAEAEDLLPCLLVKGIYVVARLIGIGTATVDYKRILPSRKILKADLYSVAVAVLDRLYDIVGTLVCNDVTLVDNDNSLAYSLYLCEDVGGENDRVTLCKCTEKVSP